MSTSSQPTNGRRTISDVEIDSAANALFSAFTSTLGRPFKAGSSRNIRTIARGWCPLKYDFSFVDPADFKASYLPAHFFDRYLYTAEKDVEPLVDSAVKKFMANIERGHIANEVLLEGKSDWLTQVLREASLLCHRILGELDITQVWDKSKHGPNGTVSIERRHAFLDVKSVDISGTGPAVQHFAQHYLRWDETLLSWFRSLPRILCGERKEVRIVEGNKLSFVPKKFDSLRTMAAEGTLNQYFQLGTGVLIQELLCLFANIDLQSQADCHRKLAVLASLGKAGLATVDWSEASDRIWINLIRLLAPIDWFEWFMAIRSPVSTFVDDKLALEYGPVKLPMIGTMGNGFVFPLQTLVFLVLLRAVARVEKEDELVISVFGDDCIVPQSMMPAVERLATELAWKVNVDKSFFDGGFRESCGADAYRGLHLRPFKIRRPDSKDPNVLRAWAYTAVNGLVRSAELQMEPLAWGEFMLFLEEFFEEYGLGRVHIVPPRYPETSGIQMHMWRDFEIVKTLEGKRQLYHWPVLFNGDSNDLPPRFRCKHERALAKAYKALKSSSKGTKKHKRFSLPADFAVPYTGVIYFEFNAGDPRPRRVLTEFPYYHMHLKMGRTPDESADWRDSMTYLDTLDAPVFTGAVAKKATKYCSRTTWVHTWSYWLP